MSKAPYKRVYKHTSQRGNELKIDCGACGRRVPKWKTFVTYRGMRINDPAILQQVDKRMLHLMTQKTRVCPKCARFYGVVQIGKSERKKGFRSNNPNRF
ncbi:hypothetical protein A3K63_04260 [Candidatus Micrarchaeota archaeon RBG_16_49_10]|nr:MAG: hypothetical protein A3K63_04260 [Candidatus Micrarchaeota archaeon RBG_16_49_10]